MEIQVHSTTKKRRSNRSTPHKSARRAAEAMAAAAALAGGTQAYAAPVRFDNPPGAGHFTWYGGPNTSTNLHIKLPANAQTGVGSPPAGFDLNDVHYGAFAASNMYAPAIGTYFEVIEAFPPYYYVQNVNAGTLIPSGAYFGFDAYVRYVYGAIDNFTIPENVPTYIGVVFDEGGGAQFGWIGVVRTGFALDAFAWGYETTPGAPIAAGASGAAPLLGDMNNDSAVNALDVPAFVNALLGLPLPPGSVNRSDMNASGATDGDDVRPFVNVLL